MSINYEPTQWHNGKTVLRASHLEKIEKGITDIIDYNNSIYTDEDRRKENEIRREEEHNKKLEEINSAVKDMQADYDALEKIIIDENASVNLQNQINNVNYQINNVNYQINNVNSQLAHKANLNTVFNMANMGQDIKEAMTGGSVAVVGGSCVEFNNLSPTLREGIEKEVIINYKENPIYDDRTYYSAKNGIGGATGYHQSELSNFCCIKLKVVSGQKIQINRHMSGSTYCNYILLDSNENVLSYEIHEGNTTPVLVTNDITIPGNASYICINARRPVGEFVFSVITETNDLIASRTYVNDKIDEIAKNYNGYYSEIELVNESIQDNTYATLDYRNDRCRSNYIPVRKGDIIIDNMLDNHTTDLFFYDENYSKDYKISLTNEYTCLKDGYLRFRMKYSDNREITEELMNNLASQLNIKCIDIASKTIKETYKYNKTIRRNVVQVIDQIPLPEENSLGSDFIIIDNILYMFYSSNDEGTNYGIILKFLIDFENKTLECIETVQHNLGHVNTVSYNKENDTLILGNGSSDYSLTGEIIIIENFKNKTSLIEKNNDCIVIDCKDYNLGAKFNVVWGEDNWGNNDIAYLITTDGHCVRKLQLGQGDNIFSYGIKKSNTTKFNGTFNIIEESYQNDYGYGTCVQGGEYYKGCVLYAYGHDKGGISIRKATMSNELIIEDILYKRLDVNGTALGGTSGLTVYNGDVVVGFDNKIVFINI